MSLIAGLRAPDAGTLTLDGQPLNAASSGARLSLGLVPEHIALYPELNADENLHIFGALYGLRGADLRAASTPPSKLCNSPTAAAIR